LGKDVVLYGNIYLDANGPDGRVTIGSSSHVDQFCVLYGQGGLWVGNNCGIASAVVIYTQSNQDSTRDGSPVTMQPTAYAPVSIEDGAWIGTHVSILPGVVIGEGSTVGAGAVVLRSIPAHVTAYGVPAKVAVKVARS
jgi:acetyltransferase-like isoleucine patch superfamily enzyme